jgi:hypothetical protein
MMAPGHPPRFSILLPTHNRADVLPFAIRSVLAQRVQDFELLIVGDGCTDQTAQVVQGFADPRIRWFDLPKAPNFGYANRNLALRKARGESIAFMAHDDLWFPDHLELLGPYLEQPGIELVYSRPLWVAQGTLIVPGTFNLNHAPTLDAFLARTDNGIPASCVLHRSECFAKYGYWDETLPGCGDWDMWARIIDGGGRANYVSLRQPTCLHFRAHWRTEEIVVHQLGPDWEPFRTLGSLIPSALHIQDTGAATPQEAVWQAISAQPEAWTRQVRESVHRVLDLRVSNNNDLINTLQRRAAENEQRIQALAAEAVELRQQVQTLTAEGFERHQQIQVLAAEAVERHQQMQALAADAVEHQQQTRALELALNEIKTSKAWRVAVWLRRLRLWLVPQGSRRAHFLQPLYRSILSLRKGG